MTELMNELMNRSNMEIFMTEMTVTGKDGARYYPELELCEEIEADGFERGTLEWFEELYFELDAQIDDEDVYSFLFVEQLQ